MRDKILSEYLGQAGQMLDALQSNPELAALFDPYPTNADWRAETYALYEEVQTAVNTQINEKAQQIAATQAYNQAQETANQAYKDTLQIARVAFMDDPEAQIALDLNGRRAVTQNGWLKQVRGFYQRLLEDPAKVTQMTAFNYTQEQLQQEAQLVETANQAKIIQNQEKADSQAATQARDEKIETLDKRLRLITGLAPIALKKHPQWQEKLGIIERR